ncbi:16S rRNA (guanine(966)-N(2))-methyltransferase RsmD [uncultured Sphingomonas sp.]|uniref:16S rRNA (guanine(966)-N(2))-methyltransferase RsmD n=1 Tax=uncultured Sphingomonas sp. TaxID=158754 RepID=UPI0025FE2BF5|nr:16S rRNA (guanine(966)-N(2))-methyltransferase RsmD [uncultured Sphingomonas sp.]
MRIIAGAWRGRTLTVPAGATTRPTGDRTREALFSILTSRIDAFDGLMVADIFAGTGALGLEALSRGAAHCTFVDQDREALKAIRANIEKLGADADVIPSAVSGLGPSGRAYDLLMFDPPYGSGGAGALIERLTRLGWAAPGAWATVETRSDEHVSAAGWLVEAEKSYGLPKLTVLRRAPEAPPH